MEGHQEGFLLALNRRRRTWGRGVRPLLRPPVIMADMPTLWVTRLGTHWWSSHASLCTEDKLAQAEGSRGPCFVAKFRIN